MQSPSFRKLEDEVLPRRRYGSARCGVCASFGSVACSLKPQWITPPRSVRSRRLGFSGKASSALTAKPTANDMTASCFRCSRRTSITCKSSDLGCGEIPHRRRAGLTRSVAADRRRPQPSRADDPRGGGLGMIWASKGRALSMRVHRTASRISNRSSVPDPCAMQLNVCCLSPACWRASTDSCSPSTKGTRPVPIRPCP